MIVRISDSTAKTVRNAVAAMLLLTAGACGQIGPLYLPDQTESAPEQTETSTEDDKSDDNTNNL